MLYIHLICFFVFFHQKIIHVVLIFIGRLEKDDLNAKLGKLFRRIDAVKSEVYEGLENEYVHFLPYLSVAPELTDRVDTMRKEVKEATDKIQTDVSMA